MEAVEKIHKLLNRKSDLKTAELRKNMQEVMQQHASVFRIEESLQKGVQKICLLYTSPSPRDS